jgi:hypothetical protein
VALTIDIVGCRRVPSPGLHWSGSYTDITDLCINDSMSHFESSDSATKERT